ncbi:sacsin N-terminal ATP-binding-like domain-containing protein [Halomarina ordinaria]|uniref:Sacsin N-terminal ATP-binding-like domain-containing protein n=1 Tax=Halomarina ordinaria TaxID=3033939 RepID=A0ABD5UK44_9EURY|nr:hypothetical protein [Halomarina sp. PSRA2]
MSARSDLRKLCRREQRDLLLQLRNSSGWRKEGDLGVGNEAVSEAHDNRTILELIQNARDAIRRGRDDASASSDRPGSVAVIVGPDSLYVANTGRPFRLHDEQVFEAVTALNRSEKADERGAIGEKGVGMKSILQTAKQFSIESIVVDERVSVGFSRSQSVSMLLDTYTEFLDDPDFRSVLDDEYDSTVVDACESIVGDLSLPVSSATPDDLEDEDLAELQPVQAEQIPPNPLKVLRDIPRLSLFRYPFVDGHSSSDGTGLTEVLLKSTTPMSDIDESVDDDLEARLSAHRGKYRTVLELEYDDEQWTRLLDTIQELLTDLPLSDEHPDVARQFRDQRSDGDNESATQLWGECTDLGRETLVLLGEIRDIEFLRVTRDEVSGQLELAESRRVEITTGESRDIESSTEVDRQSITVSEATDDVDEPTEKQFRLYSRPVDIDPPDDEDSDEDDWTFDEPMRLLFESPRPADDGWAPERKTLYLFYPIEDARTSFPFVVHAPFQVGFDRQELDDSDVNRQLLSAVPDLVAEAAVDLARPDSRGGQDNYDAWMPWLVMPFRQRDENSLDVVSRVCEALRETPIVPSHGGEIREPTEVLVDPDRLYAFEPLRAGESPPIVAKESVTNGDRWLQRARANGEIQAENREVATRIGLTAVVDQPFHRDGTGGSGLVSTLRDVWGGDPDRWAVPIDAELYASHGDDEPYARHYFESICAALDRYDSEDEEADEQEDGRDPARKLGDWHVPLLPGEAHGDDPSDETDMGIGYLVRASTREPGGHSDRYERSDRIVFRRSKETSQSAETSIDQLVAPPKSLDIYITPFDEDWSGTLAANYNEWGTRELRGPATYYQRVAAEIGGFSAPRDARLEVDDATLGYLLDLYQTVCVETSLKRAPWLRPTPHRNRQFSAGENETGVEDLLVGESLRNRPSDYDTFLERRYSQRVPVPTADGGVAPAERLVFGQEWVDAFESIADDLESGSVRDPFTGSYEEGLPARARDLRRWAAVIECTSMVDREGTLAVAPPSDERWLEVVADTEVRDGDRALWLLNFLIHVGVQVGPHVEWGWFFPGSNGRDRDTGAMTLTEAKQLTTGGDATVEDSPIDPPAAELDTYASICWRTEHHPAVSAGHTSTCRGNLLEDAVSEWIQIAGNDIVVPTWWRFTELDILDDDTTTDFRRAILLLWPELSEHLFETAWFCTDTGHSPASNNTTIPALGLVQLQTAYLWPTDWPSSGLWKSGEGREGAYRPGVNPARRLVFDPSDGGSGRRAEAELPTIDTETLREDVSEACEPFEIDPPELDLRAVAGALGAKPIADHTPAEAAAQLDWFLRTYEAAATDPLSDDVTELPAEHMESVRRATFGLLRRFVTWDHLRDHVPDMDDELQRAWQRRDIWHVGTRLLVNRGGALCSVTVGEGRSESLSILIDVYTDRLPEYARDILEGQRSAFVELPATHPGGLALVLGDRPHEDPTFSFGIRTKGEGEIPELEPVEGPSTAAESYDSALQRVAEAIDHRVPYLVAAYDRATTSQTELEAVYTALQSAATNEIGIVDRSDDRPGDRRSALWVPTEESAETRIAFFEESLRVADDESIPPFYAAEGLVQILDDQPSRRVRNAFENVLMKTEPQLDREYEDDLADIERQIAALNERRLRRIHAALETLLDHLRSSDSESGSDRRPLPEIAWSSVDAETVLNAVTDVDPEADEPLSDLDPIATWHRHLCEPGGLSEEDATRCTVAAAKSRPTDRQRLLAPVARRTPHLDLASLAKSDPWADLDEWGESATYKTLEDYVTAITAVEKFWAVVTQTTDPGEDVLLDAVAEARRRTTPTPTASTSDVIPTATSLPDHLQDVPLVALPADDSGPVPPVLRDTVVSWCRTQRSEVVEMDVVFADEANRELFDSLCEALESPASAETTVREVFETVTEDRGRSSPVEQERTRKRRTEEWFSEESPVSSIDFSQSDLSASDPPESRGSPSVGNKSGTPSSYSDAEIAAGRGRDGELICIERAWDRFESLAANQRSRVVDAVEEWRDYDDWRMKSASDAVTDAAILGLKGIDDYAVAKRHLTAAEIDDKPTARAVFHALVDTSEERGPGFDYIDPFGRQYGPDATDGWERAQMTRTEVKTVLLEETDKGRFKLTGNEFRMARRPGPSADGGIPARVTVDRYLVRMVRLPRGWEKGSGWPEIEFRDIEDVVRFGDFDHEEDPVWEKLRGGKFYVNFELGG